MLAIVSPFVSLATSRGNRMIKKSINDQPVVYTVFKSFITHYMWWTWRAKFIICIDMDPSVIFIHASCKQALHTFGCMQYTVNNLQLTSETYSLGRHYRCSHAIAVIVFFNHLFEAVVCKINVNAVMSNTPLQNNTPIFMFIQQIGPQFASFSCNIAALCELGFECWMPLLEPLLNQRRYE